MSDIFSAEKFLSFFSPSETEEIKNRISLVESIDSTSTALLAQASRALPLLDENGKPTESGKSFNFKLLAAESQTKGHGRMGRTFVSPVTNGIYFSIACIKENGISDPAIITIAAGIGVSRAIEKTYGIECKVKWVNDVYCNNKKVCGILAEGIVNSSAGRIDGCVIGIGINLRTDKSFNSELKIKAGGILDEVPPEKVLPSRAEFLACCYKEIKKILSSNENIIEEYKNRSMLTGKNVTVTPVIGDDKTSYSAEVLGISDKAELIVRLENGTVKNLSSGEVSLHATIF